MSLIVQKYGGTSVGDADKIKNVARRVAAAKNDGNKIVVVVSAMGDTTDDLIELSRKINPNPDPRELDVLLSTGELISSTLLTMALHAMGMKAISLSGHQAGIVTDSLHSHAHITHIEPKRIIKELEEDNIIIVAGFQGISTERNVTTLGRGGSDTTAVALAASLKADRAEIYTDVDGVYTADPRLVPDARRLDEIRYDEMLEMATLGAKVMHPRAVEVGELYNMPIIVACSFNDNPGTIIHGGVSMEIRNKVRGIAHELNVAKVSIIGVPDRPGIAAEIFDPLSKANISVDTIVQNASVNNIADLSFTVAKSDVDKALSIIKPVVKAINAKDIVSDTTLAKVSIVGTGMQNAPGFAATMFHTLYEENINIHLITTSEIRITCIIKEEDVKTALQALHKAFELDKV